MDFVTDAVDTDQEAARADWMSPVFGDIVAKIQLAGDLEIERLLRLGVPVVVDRGNGVERLTVRPNR